MYNAALAAHGGNAAALDAADGCADGGLQRTRVKRVTAEGFVYVAFKTNTRTRRIPRPRLPLPRATRWGRQCTSRWRTKEGGGNIQL